VPDQESAVRAASKVLLAFLSYSLRDEVSDGGNAIVNVQSASLTEEFRDIFLPETSASSVVGHGQHIYHGNEPMIKVLKRAATYNHRPQRY
jgi:hypothetical protein